MVRMLVAVVCPRRPRGEPGCRHRQQPRRLPDWAVAAGRVEAVAAEGAVIRGVGGGVVGLTMGPPTAHLLPVVSNCNNAVKKLAVVYR